MGTCGDFFSLQPVDSSCLLLAPSPNILRMPAIDFTPAGNTCAQWGEGPVWFDGTLYWVDIEGHLVIAFDPATGNEKVWNVGERVGTVVPRASGGLVIAGDSGFKFLDTSSRDASPAPMNDPEADKPENRFNDGKCDPAGRFWVGTMHLLKPRQAVGALYRLDPDHSVHTMLTGITVSNGIVWNAAADTLFFIDTPTEEVRAYDYDRATGSIANQRVVADTTDFKGVPDGMAIDAEDNLWVAMCHGGQIRCFDSSNGNTLECIDCPTIEVTAPAFGGDDLADLYVATGQSSLTEGDPLAGRLLRANAPVTGAPSFAFAG